jgi:Abortive infection alpha
MSEVPDPTGGWAKATEATANASKQAIQAGRDLGRFISGPAGEVVGMLWDHVKVVRFERQVRLAERVRKFLVERGLRDPTRTIPLKVVLPLLDYATLEEDDELHDVWAMLLLNGGDADSGIEMRRAFVSVLAEMTRLDVGNLATIEQASPVYPNGSSAAVWTTQLPEKATPADRRDRDVVNTDPTLEVLTSLRTWKASDAFTPSVTRFAQVERSPPHCGAYSIRPSVRPGLHTQFECLTPLGGHRSKFATSENSLRGKRICVTGKISDYQGKPEIVLTEPSQLSQ